MCVCPLVNALSIRMANQITKQQYLRLFKKYLAGKASEQEIYLINSYDDEFENIMQQPALQTPEDVATEARIKQKLQKRLQPKKSTFGFRFKWVAAILIFSASALYINYQTGKTVEDVAVKNPSPFKQTVQPGSNKAVLILSNGKQISLDDAANGTITNQGNVVIKKVKDGSLKYDQVNAAATKEITYNSISTPKGGQYQVALPDGTIVWLNAASSLKFPTAFTSNERLVELSGEAYFEVSKNKLKPFKVTFNNQVVEVLGTHFNISAYKDDNQSQTTLLEGSVQITNQNSRKLLIPGQQAISDADAKDIAIVKPNLDEVMGWKNGLFVFKSKSIQSIMKQVARWYDIDVVYQGSLHNQIYGGQISKYSNINDLLTKLELTGTVHFKVDGRRVIVSD